MGLGLCCTAPTGSRVRVCVRVCVLCVSVCVREYSAMRCDLHDTAREAYEVLMCDLTIHDGPTAWEMVPL